MKLIAKIDFSLNGVFFKKGNEVKVETKNQLVKLNELGYIEPLTAKDIQNFGKEEVSNEETKPKQKNKKTKKEE